MISKWFGKKKQEDTKPSLPSPLGLGLGLAVDVDPLPFDMLEDQLMFELPAQIQVIEAQGEIDLGAGASLHRYYTADDAFLQVNTTGGTHDQHVDDVKLFIFYKTLHPSSQDDWDRWTDGSRIGAPDYTLDDTLFQRVWGGESKKNTAPVELKEYVYPKEKDQSQYSVTHLAMLYERQLPDHDRFEYLLISAERTGDDISVVMSVGVDLDPVSFSVV